MTVKITYQDGNIATFGTGCAHVELDLDGERGRKIWQITVEDELGRRVLTAYRHDNCPTQNRPTIAS